MNSRDDGDRGYRGHQRDRDDTPSVIRHVEPLMGRTTAESMPILEMPKAQRIWRRIRVPLFIGIVVVLLLTIGVITRGLMVASTIEKNISDAEALESEGTLAQTEAAEKTLAALYEKYSDEDEACTAWTWQSVLRGLLWGAPLSPETSTLIEKFSKSGSKYEVLSKAGEALLSDRPEDALDILSNAPSGPRKALVEALSLSAAGKRDKARTLLETKIEEYPSYVPLVTAGLQEALEDNDHSTVLHMAERLLEKSPAHLSASMAMLRLALPEWGEPEPDASSAAKLEARLAVLLPRIEAAPPKLSTHGQYLVGRVALATNHPDNAVQAFLKVLERWKKPEIAAYAAEAVRMKSNEQAALDFLDKNPEVNGPEVMDVRAQCLLRYHRVKQAEVVVEALRKSGAYPARTAALSFELAVRSGNTASALKQLPRTIGIQDKWIALELYFQLSATGNQAGITAIEKALEKNWATCSRVIRSWHSKALGRAVRQFDNARLECAESLAPRLMRKHMPVSEISAAAQKVAAQSNKSLIFEVDRAWAVWASSGYDAAVALLDEIVALKPEGEPLLEQLGRMYLELNLPNKVSALLRGQDAPELLALRITAAEAAKSKDARKLVEKALQAAKTDAHPALQYFALRQKLADGDSTAVREWVDRNSVGAMGSWASEIADLGARAMWQLEEKNESERFLQRTARQALVPGGAGESLDIFIVQVEQNINRAGKYKNQALVVIRTLKEESVRDPRMSYWLAVENILGGSERLGLRLLAEIPPVDPTYAPYYKRMNDLNRLSEEDAAQAKKMLPYLGPLHPPL